MKIRALVVGLLLAASTLVGCGKNPCEEACDKLQSCGSLPTGVSCSGDCPSQAEKYMTCLAKLSCEELKDFMKVAACAL